jgi:uncharacterized membrane protein
MKRIGLDKFTRNIAALFATLTGLYPLIYLGGFMQSHGFLAGKPAAVLHSGLWKTAFYIHISAGGFALLTGWLQFNPKRRNAHLTFHRVLGRCYVGAVALSSTAGLYIALFAQGGLASAMGFGLLALCWLFTDIMAFKTALARQIGTHRKWMVLNYSLTFAAVTLRIWLLLLIHASPFSFMQGYPVIAWLCWVPNLLVACLIVRPKRGNT